MTMAYQRRTKDQLAARVAQDIFDGAVVNLGIGQPTLVANHLPAGREVILHSENGILGMGPAPAEGEEDYDLINAGKQPVTLLPGGAYFHHADSFAMMRGGHLDICVLGAFQVSATGDLANWSTGEPDAIPAVGGAMDLAIGAKQTWVMMDLLTKKGESKMVERCTYPLTGIGCVKRIYSDLATLECTPQGLKLIDKVDGLDACGTRKAGRPADRAPEPILERQRHDQPSLHLRRHPHPLRPLRRRAVQRARRRPRRRAAQGADGAQRRASTGQAVDRRALRLRQPGRRRQPQRRAHGGAAGRPAASKCRARTINRLCGSGLDAVGTAARAIKAGEAELMIAGGVESMSRAPFVMPKAESAFSRANAVYDTTIGWRFVNKLMKAQYGVDSMPETAENVATDYKIEREAQDRMALASQQQGGGGAEVAASSTPRSRR